MLQHLKLPLLLQIVACAYYWQPSPQACGQEFKPGVVIQPVLPANQVTRNPFHLSQLALAKLDRDAGLSIVFLIEQFRTEEREVIVTRIRTEERTRTVTVDVDGKQEQREQTYTVKVPYQETSTVKARVSAGKKVKAVAWEDLRVFRLDGTVVSKNDITDYLKKTRPVFLASGMPEKCEPADQLVRQAMHEKTLVIFTNAFGLLPKP